MKYTCWGAAKQVTGSMHLLELDSGYKILVDCGIDYEDKDNKTINSHFQFNPKDIDVLLVTHAHIDHSGNIPNLVKQGFKGEIICTAMLRETQQYSTQKIGEVKEVNGDLNSISTTELVDQNPIGKSSRSNPDS